MLAKDETHAGAAAELRIIPAWARVLAGIALISMLFVFMVLVGRQPKAPPASPGLGKLVLNQTGTTQTVTLTKTGTVGLIAPLWARAPLGFGLGAILAGYLLLVGYINRDAKRRGMSRTLWTIVALLIPNALGILLYFVLRQPLCSLCPQCGHAVQTGFCYCPQCSRKLGSSCSQCQRVVGESDVYCPYCGTSRRGPVEQPG
jgi:hypothetical protein